MAHRMYVSNEGIDKSCVRKTMEITMMQKKKIEFSRELGAGL